VGPTASLDILDTTQLPCLSWNPITTLLGPQSVVHPQYLFIILYGSILFYYEALLLRITHLTEMLRPLGLTTNPTAFMESGD